MARFVAEKWRKIGRVTADDMAMKMCYSVIVQNWAMAVGRSYANAAVRIGSGFFCQIFMKGESPYGAKSQEDEGASVSAALTLVPRDGKHLLHDDSVCAAGSSGLR